MSYIKLFVLCSLITCYVAVPIDIDVNINDSEIDYWRDTNPGVRVLVSYMQSPNRCSAYRVAITNFLYHTITRWFPVYDFLPHDKTLGKSYQVLRTDNRQLYATLFDVRYDTLEVTLGGDLSISFDFIPLIETWENKTYCADTNLTNYDDYQLIELTDLN